jgi:hypothetical protein
MNCILKQLEHWNLQTVTLKLFVHYSVADPGRPKLPPKNKNTKSLTQTCSWWRCGPGKGHKKKRKKKRISCYDIWIGSSVESRTLLLEPERLS